MRNIIQWILPPLVGAIIGYITNAVAIKMLFRPLREIRLFNARLPFTPGILPRERHKLAESIGRMVEQELLTPQIIRERLAKTEVQDRMDKSLGAYTGQMLDQPLTVLIGNKGELVPANNSPMGILPPEDLPVAGMIKDFINSDIFDSFLEELIKNWMVGRSDSGFDESSSGSWLRSRLRDFGSIFVPTAKNLIKDGLVRDIKNHAQGEKSIFRVALDYVIAKYPGITVREFFSLGEKRKQKVDRYLTGKAANALDENIESALSSVDIKSVVMDRIDSLEMIRVEKIILDIMAGQLKWINFFGAILGAIIGFTQVILSLFT